MTKNERILLWYHEGIYPKFAIELVLYNKRNNEVFETNGITLSRIGLGAMRMADIQQGVDTIHAALDSGITYLTFMVTEKVNW